MSKNILSLILLAFSLSSALTAMHNHTDENEVRYIKKNVELNPQYQQQLRNAEMWQNFISQNPDWFVIFNESNQLPHRAFGAPIRINDLFSFLSTNNFVLPVDLREHSSTKNDKYINQTFVQYYNNLEVINSKFYAKFSLSNNLIAFGIDIFNDIDISVVPTINEQRAITSATSNISAPISDISVNEDLKVLANPKYRKYEYNLVYVVEFKTIIHEIPAHYICYIDAHNGELLMRKNQVMNEAPPIITNIHVEGEVYTINPYNPSSSEDFVYLKVTHNNTGYYTDSLGQVVIPSNSGNATYYLEGLYSQAQTNSVVPSFTSSLSNNNVVFDNTNSSISERTAYYAINNIHTHFKSQFPTFTGLDFPMIANVDITTGYCNAFYSGGGWGGLSHSINFYAEGGGCQATAKIPDVAYHEYSHAINDYRYNSGSGLWNGACGEGFADFWALSLTEYPVLGEGWYLNDSTSYIRRYDQDRKVYPQDLTGEVHADGEIICGAFWDTYENLGNMQQALDLFVDLYDGGPDGPDGLEGVIYTDILLEFLYSDDNDGNIFNGTPNDIAIVDAFALHGITLLSNAVLTHSEVDESLGGVQIDVDANIVMTYPWALNNAFCYYKLNNSTIWDSIPLSIVSGNDYSAQLPSQVEGTVIAYYLSLIDNYGKKAAITPFSSHLDNHANLPFFILVGYELMEEQDFDFNIGFWSVSDTSDNATTGLWEIGVPEGTYYDNTVPVQPSTQHTPGGSLCAFTGNGPIGGSIGANDVDGGHTTLTSPTYDLTNYTNPTFSYYRWYTNSTGANPAADWWQVQVTDDGSNWVYIENNMTSDNSWRKFSFRVSDYVTITSDFSIRFIASDSFRLGQYLDGGSLVEAAVDDLMLYEESVYGCTDSTAINYNPLATVDDGSCMYSCGPITGVYMSDVIHDRATFNWDDMNSSTCQVDQIRFRYREVGTNSWSMKTMGVPVGSGCNTSNTSKRVLNLNPDTQYEYDFKIWYCNASTVTWHVNGSFTTLPLCDNVINIIPTPITTTKTQFCWDSVSTYAFVRLKYRIDAPGTSFNNIGGMGVVSPILCKDKNGLTPGLTYRVMWRTWCNPSGGPYRSPQWDGPVLWTQPTSIRVDELSSISYLELYPNPSRDIFNVEFISETKQYIEVRLVNLIGEIIFTENLENFDGEYTHSFNLSEYSKGVYLLELDTDNGIVNKKLILH